MSRQPRAIEHGPRGNDAVVRPEDLSQDLFPLFKELSERLVLLELLGVGALGSVFKAEDRKFGKPCVIKVYHKGEPRFLGEYTDHLLQIQISLSATAPGSLLLPYDGGQVKGIFYQLFDYVPPPVSTLREAIAEQARLPTVEILEILAQVAEALEYLHSHQVIHGNVKPDNILVTRRPDTKAFLVDLGMVQHSLPEDSILYVGTYHYMHPALRGNLRHVGDTSPGGATLRSRIGTYVDVYALGVVALKLFAGDIAPPHRLSEHSLVSALRDRNVELSGAPLALTVQLVNLILQMLSVHPSTEGISARAVASICRSLARTAQDSLPDEEVHRDALPARAHATGGQGAVGAIREALTHLEQISRSLEVSTMGMLRTAERIESAAGPSAETDVLDEMNHAFSSAAKRTRTSWILAIAMAVGAFLLITGMIACALVLAFLTGKTGWALVFGAASVPAVIGILVWRPFDRVFRATILAQQIEMVHVQATSSYRGTPDFEKRIEICREAAESLRTLLREHDKTSNQVSGPES